MKLTAVYCVYNEKEYLEYSVKAILPAVDQVLILLGEAPYNAYNPQAREISKNDGTETIAKALALHPKVRLIKGTWASEVDHRNTGMELCREDGTDYYWLVDGDEVYRPDHLVFIRQEIEKRPAVGTFIVKCHIFWRSFSYRIPAQELAWRPRRIFKVTRRRRMMGIPFPYRCQFTGQNQTNSLGPVYEIPSTQAVFYHFSYARSQEAMGDKLSTFSHAHEIKNGWFESVWKKWPAQREMANIHPTDPPKFPRALYQTPSDLPDVMKHHPYYSVDVIP